MRARYNTLQFDEVAGVFDETTVSTIEASRGEQRMLLSQISWRTYVALVAYRSIEENQFFGADRQPLPVGFHDAGFAAGVNH